MKRFAAPIILLLFVGIGFAIYHIFQQELQPAGRESAAATAMTTEASVRATEGGTPSPAPTPTPVPTPTPTATPIPTMPPTPSPTPSPEPTPTPSPTPEPTPTPYIVKDESGSFRSDTGTFLNLVVDYYVKRDGEKAKLTVYVYTESYGLSTVARNNDVRIVIDGVTTYCTAGSIEVTDNEQLSKTLIGKAEADVVPESSVRVDASWEFLGTMSEKYIDVLSASDTIRIP